MGLLDAVVRALGQSQGGQGGGQADLLGAVIGMLGQGGGQPGGLVYLAGWLAEHGGGVVAAWQTVFWLLAGLFVAAGAYHLWALPRPAKDLPVPRTQHFWADFLRVFAAFFRQRDIVRILAFLLLYRFAEAQLLKLVTPFLLDGRDIGGLGLKTQDVGIAYGTVGVTALTLGGLLGGGTQLQTLLVVSAGTLGVIATVGWTVAATRWWEPLAARLLGTERAAALQDAARAFGSHRGALLGCLLLSVAAWLVDFCSLWLLARAVGLAVGLPQMMVAAAAAYVAAALPISIGGHGVREGTLVAVLGVLGCGAGSANALFAVAFWASSVGWSLVGGGVYLLSILTGWPLPRGGLSKRVVAVKAG